MFLLSLSVKEAIGVILVENKTRRQLLLAALKNHRRRNGGWSASQANDISLGAAIAAVSSDLDGILSLKLWHWRLFSVEKTFSLYY